MGAGGVLRGVGKTLAPGGLGARGTAPCAREAPRKAPREAPSAATRVLSDATAPAELCHVLSGKTCASCSSPLLRAVILWKTLLAEKTELLNIFFS